MPPAWNDPEWIADELRHLEGKQQRFGALSPRDRDYEAKLRHRWAIVAEGDPPGDGN